MHFSLYRAIGKSTLIQSTTMKIQIKMKLYGYKHYNDVYNNRFSFLESEKQKSITTKNSNTMRRILLLDVT